MRYTPLSVVQGKRMSVPNWKERYNPILVLCIAVAFCAALYLMQIRVGIEKRNDTVEQTLDHQES